MNSFEALGRSLDQGRNDLWNQLLNPNVGSQNLTNSLNVPLMNNINDSNNMASLMAQARYQHELSLMRNNLAAGAGSMLPNQLFPKQNNLPPPSFLMQGLEKQNRPSPPLGVEEDIAATSMLSMSSGDGSGAPAGGMILPYPAIPEQKNLPTPSVLMKGLEKQNRPSPPLGVEEDIAVTSMLSMNSGGVPDVIWTTMESKI